MGATGLQTHIWNNEAKTVMLLAGFPLLLALLSYGLFLGFAGLSDSPAPFTEAAEALAQAWPFAVLGAALWFAIAFFTHQAIIDAAVGARAVTRREEPRVYNLLEALCISRGMAIPTIRIVESQALNAFASGLAEGQYSVTVTRGLLLALTDDELEAVLAHELSHIRNHDVRLLVVAVVFVGIFSFVGEVVFRGLMRGGVRVSGGGRGRNREGGGGGAGAAIIVALLIIAIAYALAVVIRFALSRNREFLADAGAVELTKNPDALITALRKVSGAGTIERAPSELREMFFENAARFGGALSTHPSIEARIAALKRFAGGRDAAPEAAPTRADPRPRSGPWG